jgi:hypothetical protein
MSARDRPARPAADNLEPAAPRLLDVAEGDRWEAELRRSLTERAGRVRPSGVDLAGAVIARARRVRRRRQAAGLAAVVMGTVLATGVWWHDSRPEEGNGARFEAVTDLAEAPVAGDESPPVQPPQLATDQAVPATVSADVIGDGTDGGVVLATDEGQVLDLGPIRQVVSARRIGDGWAVVSGGTGTARLWWVQPDRRPVALLAGMDAVVVDRERVAWRRGAVLSAATLSPDGELTQRVSTAAPEGDGLPVGFVGGVVLLTGTDPGGWDTWDPARGDYRPAWTRDVIRVYGTLPDAATAVALVPPEPGAEGSCLARLDAKLVASQVRCVPETLPADGPAAISPEGRWLVTGSVADALLVDLAEAFGAWPERAVVPVAGVPGPATTPIWLELDRVLFTTSDSLVQVWPDRARAGGPDAVDEIPLRGTQLLVVQPE